MDEGSLDFVAQALALKDEPRQGWFRAGVERPESVADHSWGVALLALVLARERGLDEAKAVRLALVHDLAEAVVGDLVPGEYATKEAKLELERRGLETMLEPAPDALRARLLEDFDDLAQSRSPEAHLVHELDKLEMGLQARRYERAGVAPEKLAEFVASARAGVRDEAMRRALER